MSVTFNEVLSSQPLRSFSLVTFIICAIVLVADGMDAQLLGIVAPLAIEEYGIDRGTFGIAMSAALVGFGLGSWGGGWFGDRVGRRWSLALAATIFSLGTIAASTSGDVWQMAFWRLISGLGFGSAYANAIALTGEWLPERWRSVGVTTISVGTPAGGMVVSAMAPTLVDSFGWRGSFVFLGIATFLVVLLIIFFLRDSPTYLLARGKTEEAKKAARKISGETQELVPERHYSDKDGGSIGVLDRSNLRLNIGVGLAFTAATMVAYGILNWTTTFLQAEGFAFEQASYTVFVAGLTSIAASIAAGLLVQRFGSKVSQFAFSTGLLVTLILLTITLESMSGTPSSGDRTLVVVLIGTAAALFSACIASMYAIMTHAYPPSCRSAGIGFGIFMGRFGAIGSSGLGGWLLDIGNGSTVPFFAVLCAGAVMIFIAAMVIDRPVPPAWKVALTPEARDDKVGAQVP